MLSRIGKSLKSMGLPKLPFGAAVADSGHGSFATHSSPFNRKGALGELVRGDCGVGAGDKSAYRALRT